MHIRLYYILALIILLSNGCSSQMKTHRVQLLHLNDAKEVRYSPYLSQSLQYLNMQKYDSAMVTLHKAYSIDSTNFLIFYYYGQIYKENEDFNNSFSALNKSLSLCSHSNASRADIYLALAELEILKGDISKAKQNYLTVLQLQPDSKNAREALIKLNAEY